MPDCLHCEINELVQEHIDSGAVDMAELAAMMVESLAELILLAPEEKQAQLMADTLAHFGTMFLEKSGGAEAAGSGSAH